MNDSWGELGGMASAAPGEEFFGVADLTDYIGLLMSSDPVLQEVAVVGEVSNFKRHSSGHCYFSLKDERSHIRCCLWRHAATRLGFRPEDGDQVICRGRVDFYAPRGEVSLVVETLKFAGQGAQFEAFERLKARLSADGLLAPERKRELPALPRRIGVITSPTGAVIRDIAHVLGRRYPLATLVLIPAKVQGLDAPEDLLRALSFARVLDDLDVLIVARGGGSAEDLWCFNDEALVRALADFPIPTISAIGHETDFTLLDLVADRRAPTPSAAAEIVAPEVGHLLGAVAGLRLRAASASAAQIQLARHKLVCATSARSFARPGEAIEARRERVRAVRERLHEALEGGLRVEKTRIENARDRLRALDPLRVLERGYSLASDPKTGALITRAADLKPGQHLRLRLAHGEVEVEVKAQP